ncbi:MAG: DUF5063 domain-containing protein [Terriglobales bacterium]
MSEPGEIQASFREFTLVAAHFCDVVDSASALDRVELLSRLYEMLPRLISQGIALPSLSWSNDDTRKEIRQTRMKEAEWGQLYELLKEKLGEWNLYWQVFDPTNDSEAIRGSLADDIADIYRDIKEGLTLHNPNLALQQDAVRGWRVLYYSHWGPHAINALFTIHFLLESTRS